MTTTHHREVQQPVELVYCLLCLLPNVSISPAGVKLEIGTIGAAVALWHRLTQAVASPDSTNSIPRAVPPELQTPSALNNARLTDRRAGVSP